MMKKIFVSTLILILLVSLALGLVMFAEKGKIKIQETDFDSSSFKVLAVVDETTPVLEEDESELEYLQNQIRKLKKSVKAIPIVTAPLY